MDKKILIPTIIGTILLCVIVFTVVTKKTNGNFGKVNEIETIAPKETQEIGYKQGNGSNNTSQNGNNSGDVLEYNVVAVETIDTVELEWEIETEATEPETSAVVEETTEEETEEETFNWSETTRAVGENEEPNWVEDPEDPEDYEIERVTKPYNEEDYIVKRETDPSTTKPEDTKPQTEKVTVGVVEKSEDGSIIGITGDGNVVATFNLPKLSSGHKYTEEESFGIESVMQYWKEHNISKEDLRKLVNGYPGFSEEDKTEIVEFISNRSPHNNPSETVDIPTENETFEAINDTSSKLRRD